jgi:malonate transporter
VIATTLTVLVGVLFVLLLGYLAWRLKAFDAEQVAGINKLALDFALPASLFVGIVSIPRAQLALDVSFVVAALLAMVAVYFAALILGRQLLRLKTGSAALFALGASFPSAPTFGPAVLGGLFGATSAEAIASIAIIANLVLLPLTVVVLEASSRARSSREEKSSASAEARSPPFEIAAVVRESLVHAAKQPYVWAPIVALMFVLSGIRVPSMIISTFKIIGQTTSGVSLFVAGLLLATYSLVLNRAVALNVILKSVIEPLVLWALVELLSIPKPIAGEGVVAAALPSAVITSMLAAHYKTYQAEAGSTLLLTTVLMMFVAPVSIFVAG